MGTRALIAIEDDRGTELTLIYCHFDGHIDALGTKLKRCCPTHIANDARHRSDALTPPAHGMPCLAATVISALKTETGNIHIYPPGLRDCGQSYVYTLRPSGTPIGREQAPVMLEIADRKGEIFYAGLIGDFSPKAVTQTERAFREALESSAPEVSPS